MTKKSCMRYEKDFEREWGRIAGELRTQDDCAWLIRHASYILKTSGVLWGVDLNLRTGKMLDAIRERIAKDLAELSFILISHFHGDHFDEGFMRAIAENKTLWVLPTFTPPELLWRLARAHENIRVVSPGDVFTVGGLKITVSDGQHYDAGGKAGIPSLRFFVKTPEKSVFFPGDTRDYSRDTGYAGPRPDVMFTHLWFGRRMALEACAQECEAFCRYFATFRAKRLLLTHLYNLSRETRDDIWTKKHASQAAARFSQMGMEDVAVPSLGRPIEL